MSMSSMPDDWIPDPPDVSHLVCDDGDSVESFFHSMQTRLLTVPLASWRHPEDRPFFAGSRVGVFAVVENPALVPDVFVAFDVNRKPITGPDALPSYFGWQYGKPPDIVIEIVSKTVNDELSTKLRAYERMRASHYVVFDPLRRISHEELLAFSFSNGSYIRRDDLRFAAEGLALVRWDGIYEGERAQWLRWTDLDGNLLPTLEEQTLRADREATRAAALEARLRELGVEPEG